MAKKKKLDKVEKKPKEVKTESNLEKLKVLKEKPKGVFNGFFEFLRKYSVIGLAIGIVIGDSSKVLVNSIVSGFITPFLGLFLPSKESLQSFKVVFKHQTFEVGSIIQATLSFLIIVFIIYFVIKIILRKEEWIDDKK